jgi:3'-phosphoadenosine 5'-phosphosulfate sulfotransferase (PAPS reductase)/FAD synthetase
MFRDEFGSRIANPWRQYRHARASVMILPLPTWTIVSGVLPVAA